MGAPWAERGTRAAAPGVCVWGGPDAVSQRGAVTGDRWQTDEEELVGRPSLVSPLHLPLFFSPESGRGLTSPGGKALTSAGGMEKGKEYFFPQSSKPHRVLPTTSAHHLPKAALVHLPTVSPAIRRRGIRPGAEPRLPASPASGTQVRAAVGNPALTGLLLLLGSRRISGLAGRHLRRQGLNPSFFQRGN